MSGDRNNNDYEKENEEEARSVAPSSTTSSANAVLIGSLGLTFVAFAAFALTDNRDVLGSRFTFTWVASSLGVIVALPLVYSHGLRLYPSSFKLFQPFKGGLRFVVFQFFSWLLYVISVLLLAVGLWHVERNRGILTSAGVIAVLAQAFMVSSLLAYVPPPSSSAPREHTCCPSWRIASRRMHARSRGSSFDSLDDENDDDTCIDESDDEHDVPEKSSVRGRLGVRFTSTMQFEEDLVERGTDKSVASQFMKMNIAIVVIGFALSSVAEKWGAGSPLGTGYAILSLLCCIIAVSLTHGLGGRLYNSNKGWSFVQPFRGGGAFVVMQILGWTILGVSLASQVFFIIGSAYLGFQAIVGFMYVGGSLAVVAQAILLASIFYFKGDNRGEKDVDRVRLREERRFKNFGTRSAEHLTLLQAIVERYIRVRDSVFMNFIVALFFNLQFVSFSCYLLLILLPYYLPRALLPFADRATLGLVPNIGGPSWAHLAAEEKDAYAAVTSWFWLSTGIGIWMFCFSAIRTLGIVKGWRASIVLALFALGSIGSVLHAYAGTPCFKMLCLLGSANLVYMSTTYQHMPERTGARTWGLFKNSPLFDEFRKYFDGSVTPSEELLDNAGKMKQLGDPKNEGGQVIVCFHPHGVFPSTCMWLTHAECWKRYFPMLDPVVLVATIIHLIPVMRDIAQWSGCRDVARGTVIRLLKEGESPLIVIGGQTEMFESRSWDKGITVMRRRRGFIKLAIKHNVGLLPTFSFGETQTMDNLYLPKMQAWTKKRLGFPIPYWPYGRWGLPIPRRKKITLAVGAPIYPVRQTDAPTDDEVTELQNRYFDALERLFEEKKSECGFSDSYINWLN